MVLVTMLVHPKILGEPCDGARKQTQVRCMLGINPSVLLFFKTSGVERAVKCQFDNWSQRLLFYSDYFQYKFPVEAVQTSSNLVT